MADIKQIQVGQTTYDIKDETARNSIPTVVNALGDSTSNTISQKAVTDELLSDRIWEEKDMEVASLDKQMYYINYPDGVATWYYMDSYSYNSHVRFAVTPGQVYKVVSENNFDIEFLRTLNMERDAVVDIAGDYIGWKSAGTYYYEVPAEATYMYIRRTGSQTFYLPQYIGLLNYTREHIEGIDDRLDILEDDKNFKVIEIPFTNVATIGGYYISGGVWGYTSSASTHNCRIMSCEAGDIFKAVPQEGKSYNIEFLTDATYSNGGDSHLAYETPIGFVSDERIYTAPLGTKYIYIRCNVSKTDRSPAHLYKLERKTQIVERLDASELKSTDNTRYLYGVEVTEGVKLLNNGYMVNDASWAVTDFIPCEEGDVVSILYGLRESGTSCLWTFDSNKNYKSYYGAYQNTTGTNRSVTIPSGVAYVRLSYSSDGCVVVNGKEVFSTLHEVGGTSEDIEAMFIGQTYSQEFSATGAGSTWVTFRLGKLKVGAKYRIVIDDTAPWETYTASVNTVTSRFNVSLTFNGSARSIYNGVKALPVPEQFDFIAEANDYYYIGFRATSGTEVSLKLLSPIDTTAIENMANADILSMAKEAHYVYSGLPVFGLLHYSDIHASGAAVSAITTAITTYAEYLDDVINTGDVALASATTEATGAAWWKTSGLADKSLFTLGNHDVTGSSVNDLGQAYGYDNYFADYVGDESPLGYVMPEGYNVEGSEHYKACYWYKDYPQHNVRVIGLDCMNHFDGVMDATTGEITTAGVTQTSNAQERWLMARLADTLDSTNSAYGYSVIICGHYPLDDFGSSGDPTAGDNKTWNDTTHEWICNMDSGRVINKRTNDVVNFHRYSTTAFEAEVSFHWRSRTSATSKGSVNNVGNVIKAWMDNGGELVAFLSGHTHADKMYYPTLFPNILNVSIEQAGHRRPSYYVNRSDVPMIANLLFVDTNSKLLKIVRIGNTGNIRMISTSYLCYDYANRKVLAEG